LNLYILAGLSLFLLFLAGLKLLKVVQLVIGEVLPDTPLVNQLKKVQTILANLFALVLPVD
jgi:hypothetical protein